MSSLQSSTFVVSDSLTTLYMAGQPADDGSTKRV